MSSNKSPVADSSTEKWEKLASKLGTALALTALERNVDPSSELTCSSTDFSSDFSWDDDDDSDYGEDSTRDDVFTEDYWNMDLDDLLKSKPIRQERKNVATYSELFRKNILPQDASARPIKGLVTTSDAVTGASKPKNPRRPSVSFSKVEIRVFERILVDNPSCSSGPSMGLGWNYMQKDPVKLDKYETKRTTTFRHGRRPFHQLSLSASKREKMAKKWGFTKTDIRENIKQIQKIQKQREITLIHLETDGPNQESINNRNNDAVAIFKRAQSFLKPRDVSSCALQGQALRIKVCN